MEEEREVMRQGIRDKVSARAARVIIILRHSLTDAHVRNVGLPLRDVIHLLVCHTRCHLRLLFLSIKRRQKYRVRKSPMCDADDDDVFDTETDVLRLLNVL